MKWVAWNNGQRSSSGAGYGLRVPVADRNKYFKRSWKSVTLELRTGRTYRCVKVNLDKPSFWENCPELISKEIGQWLIRRGCGTWPSGNPPRFDVTHPGGRVFRVR